MIYPATPANITAAAALIRRGDLVVFPTETVYGLGADALNEQAVRRIFEVKGRPHFNPLIVHIHSIEQIDTVADAGAAAALLERLKRFWPGPLSVVLPKRPCVPGIVTAGLDSVAVRIPAHPAARALLLECGCPIAAPSANAFMEVSPTRAEHAAESFGEAVPFVLDGGACSVGLESTVISLLADPPVLLRPGGVTLEQLRGALGEVAAGTQAGHAPRSPGMLRKHYSPKTKVALRGTVPAEQLPPRIGLICFEEGRHDECGYCAVKQLSGNADLQEVAANIFHAMRELDRLGLDLIIVDTCEESGLGLAIMDRLRRAADEGA